MSKTNFEDIEMMEEDNNLLRDPEEDIDFLDEDFLDE